MSSVFVLLQRQQRKKDTTGCHCVSMGIDVAAAT